MKTDNLTQHNTRMNFKARRIAYTKPVGLDKAIEIYSLNSKDRPVVRQIIEAVNMEKLLPARLEYKNFSIWQKIINAAAAFLGQGKKQSAFLAVQNKKPCGIMLTNSNRKEGTVGIIATWPVKKDTKVKKAGSSLFTAFLDIAQRKGLRKISLEPVINGPTDAVGFYQSHGMHFPDSRASVMTSAKQSIKDTFEIKKKELNYVTEKNPVKTSIKNVVDLNFTV